MTTHENNSIKINGTILAILVQFLILLGGFIGGYATLKNELGNVKTAITTHINSQDDYLRINQWETRNQFIDEKLDRLESKVDELLTIIAKEGVYVPPGAGARAKK